MYLDSRHFSKGRRTYLKSPSVHVQNERADFRFSVHMKVLPYQRTAELALFQTTNSLDLPDRLLWKYTGDVIKKWISVIVTLDPGEYKLIFSATAGAPFESDVALDDFSITRHTIDAAREGPYGFCDGHVLNNVLFCGLAGSLYFDWAQMIPKFVGVTKPILGKYIFCFPALCFM